MSDTVNVKYVGKKKELNLKLNYMFKPVLFDEDNDYTAEMDKIEAEILVAENPRSYVILDLDESEEEPFLGVEELEALTKKQIANYMKARFGKEYDPGKFKKAGLVAEALKLTSEAQNAGQ